MPVNGSSHAMPALFIGHGSPMNAIEDSPLTRAWREVAWRLPRPRAVLVISAHWETDGTYLQAGEAPETIHDFIGFPRELYLARYPATGHPQLAQRIARMIDEPQMRLDVQRGFDHGAWSVLRVMFPKAEVPVLQLSLDRRLDAAGHYRLARRLAPLRDEGVLVLGSGNIVHNLRLYDFRDPSPQDWALRASRRIVAGIGAGDHLALVDWEQLGADVRTGIPTPEHYLPLLYVLALRGSEPVTVFNDVVVGSLSMASVVVGHLPDADPN